MKYTIPALIALGGAHAWDAEYDGFYHWKIWNGGHAVSDSTILHEKLQFTNGKLPLDVSLDWCAAEPECEFITYTSSTDNPKDMRRMDRVDTNWDTYVSYLDSAVPLASSALCQKVDDKGPGSQDVNWLKCKNDMCGDSQNEYATFDLPPDLIHSSCVADKKCIGFKVNPEGTRGVLFQYVDYMNLAYFKYTGDLSDEAVVYEDVDETSVTKTKRALRGN